MCVFIISKTFVHGTVGFRDLYQKFLTQSSEKQLFILFGNGPMFWAKEIYKSIFLSPLEVYSYLIFSNQSTLIL